jgi:hypothetical protein
MAGSGTYRSVMLSLIQLRPLPTVISFSLLISHSPSFSGMYPIHLDTCLKVRNQGNEFSQRDKASYIARCLANRRPPFRDFLDLSKKTCKAYLEAGRGEPRNVPPRCKAGK